MSKGENAIMFTLLFCIAVFDDISFSGLTIPMLMDWLLIHPFVFLFVIFELCGGIKISIGGD